MGYSEKCPDLQTRWVSSLSKCVPCDLKPGACLNPRRGSGAPERRADLSFLWLQDTKYRRTAATMTREDEMRFPFGRAEATLSTTAAAAPVSRAGSAPPATLRSAPAPQPPTPSAGQPREFRCLTLASGSCLRI